MLPPTRVLKLALMLGGGGLFKRLTLEMLLNKIVPLSQKVLYLAMPVAIESAEAENRLPEVWQ